MKKILTGICLLLLNITVSNGQWYVKKYNVTDINLLSLEQLNKSLSDSKTGLLNSGVVAGIGAALFVAARFFPDDDTEDPNFWEVILGKKVINDIAIVTGAGLFAGGTIGCIVCLGRSGQIRSAINRNYPVYVSININPAIINERYSGSLCPGFTLTFHF